MTALRKCQGAACGLVLLICAGMSNASAAPAPSDVVGTMTAEYLLSCQRNQDDCITFTNRVLEVLSTAASFQQKQIYKGCAPVPLDVEGTGQLVKWILTYPQQATGYAADDIAKAAEALWPCK